MEVEGKSSGPTTLSYAAKAAGQEDIIPAVTGQASSIYLTHDDRIQKRSPR